MSQKVIQAKILFRNIDAPQKEAWSIKKIDCRPDLLGENVTNLSGTILVQTYVMKIRNKEQLFSFF
jgi:hypothetical protein